MYMKNEGGRTNVLNLVNLGLRVLQIIFGAAVVGLYASQYSHSAWKFYAQIWDKFGLGVAAGALALITAPVLAAIPFFLGYVIVMWCFVWDFIVTCVYAGTFAYFRNEFRPYDKKEADAIKDFLNDNGIDSNLTETMQAAVTVVLVAMCLWLISLLMALGALIYRLIKR